MNEKFSILLIEDEAAIRNGLLDLFVYHGYDVETAADGAAGLELALSGKFDLIVLDVMLPGLDGYSVCNRIRERSRSQPIVMLTAKSSEEDIISGLSLGADDYITKPFSIRELVLRVEAVLRRSKSAKHLDRKIHLGKSLVIDSLALTAEFTASGKTIELTRREVEILSYLQRNSDRPVPREELLDQVWGYSNSETMETRTVDIHIAKLRRKIEANPKEPALLVTVRGEGYQIKS